MTTTSNSIYDGYEIIAINRDSACFLDHEDLFEFQSDYGISEKTLFWSAAKGEMIHFDGRDWTVDFLLPYDPSANLNRYPGGAEKKNEDLAMAS
mgnify:CR=1 FL=1